MKWRWHWKDFGFRFSTGGSTATDFYEASADGLYYAVPKRHRKVSKDVIALYYSTAKAPVGFQTAECPWLNYDRHWDEIVDRDGWPLNYAGCLDHEEIQEREHVGVGRALEYLSELRYDTPVTVQLVRDVHRELMGEIYPFAGEWRTVRLAKGNAAWPLPPNGIAPHVERLEASCFSRTPFISNDRDILCGFVAELINEILAVHPFREGNGRVARLVGGFVFLQNDFPPVAEWDRETDGTAYIAACEAGRQRADHAPLAAVLRRWLDSAIERGGRT